MSVAVVLPEVSHPHLAAIFHFILGFLSCFFNSCCLGWLCASAALLLVKGFFYLCVGSAHEFILSSGHVSMALFHGDGWKRKSHFYSCYSLEITFMTFTRLTVHPPAASRAFVWMRGFVFATLSLLKPVGSAATVIFLFFWSYSHKFGVPQSRGGLRRLAWVDVHLLTCFSRPTDRAWRCCSGCLCVCQTVSTSAARARTWQEQSSCVKALTSSLPLMRSNYPEHIHKQHHLFLRVPEDSKLVFLYLLSFPSWPNCSFFPDLIGLTIQHSTFRLEADEQKIYLFIYLLWKRTASPFKKCGRKDGSCERRTYRICGAAYGGGVGLLLVWWPSVT